MNKWSYLRAYHYLKNDITNAEFIEKPEATMVKGMSNDSETKNKSSTTQRYNTSKLNYSEKKSIPVEANIERDMNISKNPVHKTSLASVESKITAAEEDNEQKPQISAKTKSTIVPPENKPTSIKTLKNGKNFKGVSNANTLPVQENNDIKKLKENKNRHTEQSIKMKDNSPSKNNRTFEAVSANSKEAAVTEIQHKKQCGKLIIPSSKTKTSAKEDTNKFLSSPTRLINVQQAEKETVAHLINSESDVSNVPKAKPTLPGKDKTVTSLNKKHTINKENYKGNTDQPNCSEFG